MLTKILLFVWCVCVNCMVCTSYLSFIFSSTDADESGSEIEEASDEDKEGGVEPDSDSDAEAAITKQYQEEVKEDSASEDDNDDVDPKKKKLAKEKVKNILSDSFV